MVIKVAFALALLLGRVEAFPTGAGDCDEGNLLANGDEAIAHRRPETTTGSLADKNFTVLIDNVPLDPVVPATIEAGTAHIIALEAGDGNTFRGFLIRVGHQADEEETIGYLEASDLDEEVQEAQVCTDIMVGGVTHTRRSDKTNIEAIFTPPLLDETTANPLNLDVTMVVRNGNITSEFYYSRFTIIATSSDATPAPSPLSTGTPEPSMGSTETSATEAPTPGTVTEVPTTPAPTETPTLGSVTEAPVTSAPITTVPTTPAPSATPVTPPPSAMTTDGRPEQSSAPSVSSEACSLRGASMLMVSVIIAGAGHIMM